MRKKYTLSILCILIIGNLLSCKRSVEFDPTDFVDPRDGHRYSTIVVGNQRWMAENLSYQLNQSKYNPNNPITEYGRLYTFEQALVACPDGWHLPSEDEWKTMEYTLGMQGIELNSIGYRGGSLGSSLKSKTGWILQNGTNSLEFNAYPAGLYDNTKGSYEELGAQTYFWTATVASANTAWYRGLTKSFDGIYRDEEDKKKGLSCRCIED